MWHLAELLAGAGIAAPIHGNPEVTGVEYDSRACGPGSLFVAIPGFHVDGGRFAADAVRRGAAAVVAEREPHPRVSDPLVLVADARQALSALAATYYGHPSRRLTVAGVTGTDGKTTTASLLWAAWSGAGLDAGSMTTVDWRAGAAVMANPGRQTTLEAVDLQRRLDELSGLGVSHVAVETSSHALELHRVDDVDYRAAVYTRVTSEHLDVHGTREGYLSAKARLLEMAASRADGVAVLNRDDAFAYPRLARIQVARRLTYSVAGAADADIRAVDVESHPEGVRVRAHTPWGDAAIELRLPGRFNAENALAALAAACATGADLPGAVAGMSTLPQVTGRMERVDLGQPFAVVIDYAHTADALATVLSELRPLTAGRLWVVFGSAGQRDVEKRPAMGRVAAQLADVAVITDEDPRGEDRLRILEDIAAGATAAGGRRGETVVVVPDRRDAIEFAVAHARPGDTVLCAGKGHERTLITGTRELPWNERAVAEAAVRERAGSA